MLAIAEPDKSDPRSGRRAQKSVPFPPMEIGDMEVRNIARNRVQPSRKGQGQAEQRTMRIESRQGFAPGIEALNPRILGEQGL